MNDKNNITEEELNNISGGSDQEDIEWTNRTSYQTPIKEDITVGWHFDAVGDSNDSTNKG